MQLSNIVPSRQYSFVYEADTDTVSKTMNKGGRAGLDPNPLYGRVSKRSVYAGQAVTADMLHNAQVKLDPTYQPSATHTISHIPVESNPCVVQSLSSGELQVRIMRPRTVKEEWFVDGRPATAHELSLISVYLRSRTDNPLRVRVMFPSVERLTNVDNDVELVA